MKFITSPLVIILVATLLGVGLSSYLVLKRIPEYAALAAAMRLDAGVAQANDAYSFDVRPRWPLHALAV